MSKGQKAKISITLIAIFVAGAIAGGFGVSSFSSRGRPPALGNLSERQMSRMVSELALTEDQIARIQPIIDNISEEIRSVRHESMAEFARLYKDMEKRVIAELTSEQTDKFKARQEERRHRAENMLKQRRMDGERRGPRGMEDNRGPRDGLRSASQSASTSGRAPSTSAPACNKQSPVNGAEISGFSRISDLTKATALSVPSKGSKRNSRIGMQEFAL